MAPYHVKSQLRKDYGRYIVGYSMFIFFFYFIRARKLNLVRFSPTLVTNIGGAQHIRREQPSPIRASLLG
jgi:hypothetical protein